MLLAARDGTDLSNIPLGKAKLGRRDAPQLVVGRVHYFWFYSFHPLTSKKEGLMEYPLKVGLHRSSMENGYSLIILIISRKKGGVLHA